MVVYICHCLSLGSSHPLLPSLFFRYQLFFNSEDGEIYYYCLLAPESGYKGFYQVQIKSDFISLLTLEQSLH